MVRRTPLTTEAPAPAPPKGHPVAKWVTEGRAVVVCAEGPLAGRWYFVEDWQHRLDAANYMESRGVTSTNNALEYVLSDATRQHPTQPVSGRVLRWRGTKRREK